MTVGLNYTGEVKQAAMGLFLPFVLSHIFFNFFVCAFVNICRFGINNDFVTLQVYLLATTTESAVWVSLRTAWQCVPDLGTASSRSGIEIETTRSNSKNPSYKITIILTTTKPQSKLLKALEDKETERQRTKKWFRSNFFQVLFLASAWVSLSNVQDQ